MQVYVVLRNKVLGVLSENENPESFTFTYSNDINSEDYVFGLDSKENLSDKIFPIFEDLIPENKDKLMALKAKHSIRGTIEILLYLDNIHGSFEFYRNPNEISLEKDISLIQYSEVKAGILGDYDYPEVLDNYSLEEMPDSNYTNSDTTLGLSGYQEKYAILKDDIARTIKYAGSNQTEYFIKPFNLEFSHYKKGKLKFKEYKKRYYPYLLINEHIFMSLAKQFGFDVPYNGLIKHNTYNEYHLVIKRFDRYGTAIKFDHHTVNSLLGNISINKYDVTITDLIDVIKNRISADDKLILFKFIVFSVIISHGDLHAKNISLMYSSNKFGDKTMTIAPMYDILTTNIYAASQKEQDIGMKLNNKRSNIRSSDLLCIADLLDINQTSAKNIIEQFGGKFLDVFESHVEMLPNKIKTLPIKKGDYSNDITLHKEYLLYFKRRKTYIEKYLLEKSTQKNIF